MAFLTLPTDLTRVTDALERIATCMERAYPPAVSPRAKYLRGPELIVDLSGPAVEQRHKLEEFLDSQGLTPEEKEAQKQEISELPDAVRETLLRNISEGL